MNNTNYYINGLKTQNEKIILEIYTNYFPSVRHFLLQNSGQEMDTQDVFQKAIIQIMTRVQV